MIHSGSMFKMTACLVALLGWAGRAASAQEAAPPEDSVSVVADFLEGVVQHGEALRRLTGNVQLSQGETRLWANRALEYPARKEIQFFGEVRIVERGDSLRADQVLYNKQEKTGRAEGNVRLSDGDVVVYAPSGLYFADEKRTEFDEGVRLVDSVTVLTSRAGTYWSEEKRAEFYEDVRLKSEQTTLEADSITYFRDIEVSIARGNVFIDRLGGEEEADVDSTQRTWLFGAWAYNDNQHKYSRIRGEPLLIQFQSDSVGTPADTLIIRAHQLDASREDSLQRLIAIDSVRIWQHRIAAVGDSVVYDRIGKGEAGREEVRLFQQPMAWFQRSQVSGDTLHLKGRSGSLDTLIVRQRTFLAQEDSVRAKVHQLRGKDLLGLFEAGDLQSLDVGPNAEAIYYMQKEGKPDGAVRTSGDRILFYFQADELRQINVVSGTEGTYYPEALIPTPFELEGYRWDPANRPSKAGLLDEPWVRERLDREGEPAPEDDGPSVEVLPPRQKPGTRSGDALVKQQRDD